MQIIKSSILYVAVSLVFIAIFLSGSSSSWISTLLIILSIFILIIASYIDNLIPRTPQNILALILIALSLLVLPFTLIPHNSLEIVISLVWFFVIFIYCQKLVDRFGLLVDLSKIFVFVVTIFGIISLSRFIQIGLVAGSKLDGIVGPYYIYGNFLILPVFMSVYLAFHTKGKWQRVLWFVCCAILLSSLFLTFSLESWIAVVIASLVSILLFQKKIRENLLKIRPKFALKKLFVLVFLSFLVFCGIWYMAKQTTISKGVSGIINSTVSSYQNFDNPFITIVFIIFAGLLFWQIFWSIYKSKNFSWLPILIFTALLGSVVNSLGENEINVNQLFTFFVFSGSLYGYLLSTIEHKPKYLKYWVSYIIAVLVILSAICAIQFLRADLARERGDTEFAVLKDNNMAIKSYFESITFNSRDHLTWYSLWKLYFTDGQYDLAKNSIKKALEIIPKSEKYTEALKITLEKLGYPQ